MTMFSAKTAALRDIRVRQAFSYSYDRDLWIDVWNSADKFEKLGLPVERRWFGNLPSIGDNYDGWRLEPRDEKLWGVVEVHNEGPGIPVEFLPHIFDRFRQVERTKDRSHGGLGLGLAIVRELVNGHGGTVTADSPGKERGSTFTITLPIPAVIPAHIKPASPRSPTRTAFCN